LKKVFITCAAVAALLAASIGTANAADINAIIAAQDARIAQLEATVGKLVQVAKQQSTKKQWLSPMVAPIATFQLDIMTTDVHAVTNIPPMADYAEIGPVAMSGTFSFFAGGVYSASLTGSEVNLGLNTDLYGQVAVISQFTGPLLDQGSYVLNGLTLTLTSAIDGTITVVHLAPDYSTVTGTRSVAFIPNGGLGQGYSTSLIVGTRIN
jgi:hypothetical protein